MVSTEEKLKIAERELQIKTKELNLFHHISRIVQKSGTIEETITDILDAIPDAFQETENTCAQILLKGEAYTSRNFTETEWQMSRGLHVEGREIGTIEVFLLKGKKGEASFLKEEELLLESVAERLSKIVERMWTENILRQKIQEIVSLSTPITQIRNDLLILPLIGTLDSERTIQIMEHLLIKIRATGAKYIIMDATGVGTIDSAVAANILKTSRAVKMLGSQMIFTGIKPEIAMTMVHLGIDLEDIITRATLQEGIEYALNATGLVIVPRTALADARRTQG